MRVVSTRSAIRRILEIDDPLVHEIGEIEHATVGGEVASERRAEDGPLELQVAGTHEGEKIAHIDGAELIGLEIESEDGARKVFEAEPAGDREATSSARHQHIVQDHGISLQNRSALDRAETNAETRNAHTSALHVDLAGESRRRPRALDLDVGPERAVHLRDGWCQRLEDSEVHAVGVGADRNRSIEAAAPSLP